MHISFFTHILFSPLTNKVCPSPPNSPSLSLFQSGYNRFGQAPGRVEANLHRLASFLHSNPTLYFCSSSSTRWQKEPIHPSYIAEPRAAYLSLTYIHILTPRIAVRLLAVFHFRRETIKDQFCTIVDFNGINHAIIRFATAVELQRRKSIAQIRNCLLLILNLVNCIHSVISCVGGAGAK